MIELEKPIGNQEAERQLLGAIMLDNRNFWKVADFLEPEHFCVKEHQELYTHISNLIKQDKQANPVTLKPTLPDRIGNFTGLQYVLRISGDPTAAINVKDYGRTIAELNARVRLRQACAETIYDVNNAPIDVGPDKILADADNRLIEIHNALPQDRSVKTHIRDITENCLCFMDDIVAGRVPEIPSTGYPDLDRHIGGWGRQRFYVIGARPGQGKTAFAAASMRKVVRQKKKDGTHFGAMYFSIEVPSRDIWSRMIAAECASSHMPIEYREIQTVKYLSDIQREHVRKYASALKEFPIRICDKPAPTVTQIEAEARAEKQRMAMNGQTLDVIFIDYMQIMAASGKYKGQKVNEIGEISIGLLNMARRLDVAVVATAQLSRGVESREDKRPIMSDLRESGQIEQDANSIIFLYRPAYYDRRNEDALNDPEEFAKIQERKNDLHLLVEKSRDGTPGSVKTYCDIGLNQIESAMK